MYSSKLALHTKLLRIQTFFEKFWKLQIQLSVKQREVAKNHFFPSLFEYYGDYKYSISKCISMF